jgi:MFS family permease
MEGAATRVAAEGTFQIRRPLDALNFFLADVRDGLGPYLAIYLLTVQKWDEASIGLVMCVATLAGLLAQTPAGALVDATRAKRAVVASAALAVTLASLLLPWLPTFWPVAVSQATAHAAAAVFAPAVAAITLGVVGHKVFASRICPINVLSARRALSVRSRLASAAPRSLVSGMASQNSNSPAPAMPARVRKAAPYPKLTTTKPATVVDNAAPTPRGAGITRCLRPTR